MIPVRVKVGAEVIEREAIAEFRVVVNHEEQYSIWPADLEIPGGWTDAGFQGAKEDCLAHVERVWTDMRPLSVRG
ncbi:MbtH family NRPS accessory protein [Streptomyces sioyaensis]|uniref:MbtH family protein n=1 Tax=Streptomyces sioyaensis TaxID=67364 RepID=UPI00340CE17B